MSAIEKDMKIDVCIATKLPIFTNIPKWFPTNNIYQSHKPTLAEARNELISKTTTEWFLFVDDDIILNKNWWNKIKKEIKPDVGAIHGYGLTENIFINILRRFFILIKGSKNQRGFTSNTLIRKEAVKGIQLKRIGRLEDLELQEKIKEKGWKWIIVKAYCIHTKSGIRQLKDAWNDFKILLDERGLIEAIRMI